MVNGKKVIIVTQARIGSSRFPRKILQKLGTKSLIEHHIDRLLKVSNSDGLVVATTKELGIEPLINLLKDKNISYYQGSTNDVLDRFYNSVKSMSADFIVRVTSDCPLIDPKLISNVIEFVVNNNLDYGSNVLKESFPDGQDVEVFKFTALKNAYLNSKLKSDKEHVTPFIWRNSSFLGGDIFISDNFLATTNYSDIRMTVDEPEDLVTCQILIDHLGEDEEWEVYASHIRDNQIMYSNQKIIRNEGFIKSLKND
jgi:spore coat polysaccharide biosynthesis protein SpsF (cytidylyltransferase family)